MLINIIGSGVVGTATGRGLQDKGHDVRFHDISEQRLQELEQMGLWVTRTFPDDGDMTMICVSTPNTEKGIIDLTDIMQATREVANHLLHSYHLVVVRSTIPPATTERTLLPILETYSGKKVDADFGLCVQPEFLRAENGHDPYWDFTHPWFIVIGEHDVRAGDILEELSQTCNDERDRVDLLNAQIGEVDSQLGKLYDALETGEFKGGELAPRIKALFEKKEQLQQARAEAEEALRYHTIELADPEVVREYVQDLKALLEESSIVEQKAFLKSFVERIEVDDSEMKVIYTIPMPPDNPPAETVGVLPFVHNGPPKKIRTIQQPHYLANLVHQHRTTEDAVDSCSTRQCRSISLPLSAKRENSLLGREARCSHYVSPFIAVGPKFFIFDLCKSSLPALS